MVVALYQTTLPLVSSIVPSLFAFLTRSARYSSTRGLSSFLTLEPSIRLFSFGLYIWKAGLLYELREVAAAGAALGRPP